MAALPATDGAVPALVSRRLHTRIDALVMHRRPLQPARAHALRPVPLWERARIFLRRVGGIIFALTVLLWFRTRR